MVVGLVKSVVIAGATAFTKAAVTVTSTVLEAITPVITTVNVRSPVFANVTGTVAAPAND